MDCHGWDLVVPERKQRLSLYIWALFCDSWSCIYFNYFAFTWEHLALAAVLNEEIVLQTLPPVSCSVGPTGGHSTLSEMMELCYLQPSKQKTLLPGLSSKGPSSKDCPLLFSLLQLCDFVPPSLCYRFLSLGLPFEGYVDKLTFPEVKPYFLLATYLFLSTHLKCYYCSLLQKRFIMQKDMRIVSG